MKTLLLRHPALLLLLFTVPSAAEPASFLRKTTLTNGTLQLETAIRRYAPTNGEGPTVVLASVAHIGSTNYFAALQRELDRHPLVLFEGVGAAQPGQTPARPAGADASTPGASDPTALQTRLAGSLGLAFQLDGLDHSRANFRNRDLSLTELKQRLEGTALDGDRLVRLLSGQDDALKPLFAMLSTDPVSRALLLTVLIEVLAEAGDDLERMAALDPSLKGTLQVLLRERNDRIHSGLKEELARTPPPASIAMLYGAAHMRDLAARLQDELGYRATGEQWLPAFEVNPREAGVSDAQLTMMRTMLGALKQLPPPAPPK